MSGQIDVLLRLDVLIATLPLLVNEAKKTDASLSADRTVSELREARAAIAELIAADRYYDDAQFAIARARYNGAPIAPHATHCAEADIRRAAALARLSGAPQL